MINLKNSGLRLWIVQGSMPPEPKSTYRRNITIHVIAECIDEVLNAINEGFPGTTFHNIHSNMNIPNLVITDNAATAIIDP